MARLTGQNTLVVFIEPHALELVLNRLLPVTVFGMTIGDARVGIEFGGGPPAPAELRLQVDVRGDAGLAWDVTVGVPLQASVQASRLTVGILPGKVVAATQNGAPAPPKDVSDFDDLLQMVGPKSAPPLDLSRLSSFVEVGAAGWHASFELLPASARNTSPAIALALRADSPVVPLDRSNPLPVGHAVALAIDGASIVALLDRLAKKGRTASLPLGFAVDRLAFEADQDAIAVTGLLSRRHGNWRWGATEIAIEGRLGIRFDRAAMDATIDASQLTTSLRPGLAWAAGLVAPPLALAVVRTLESSIRSLVARAFTELAVHPIDDVERGLRDRVFAPFSRLTRGLQMSLAEVAIAGGDLWLAADIA